MRLGLLRRSLVHLQRRGQQQLAAPGQPKTVKEFDGKRCSR